jgi:hypothetical protein
MSRKPQNGPSFSKATYRSKPRTDKELAELHDKKQMKEDELRKKDQENRERLKRRKFGNFSITLRGGNKKKA